MLPDIFRDEFYSMLPPFESFIGKPFEDVFGRSLYGHKDMSMDIAETDSGYEFKVDLPGFNKDNISLTLEDGYLRIDATKEDKDKDDSAYIVKERRATVRRAVYVGVDITEEDIKARFENGVLMLEIPKKDKVEQVSDKKQIAIEG